MTQIAATSNATAPAETTRTRPAPQSNASFAAAHTAAVRDAKDRDETNSADARSTSAPKGERTEKVEGHHYLEIVSGPRNGMFINSSGNVRDGQAFLIVRREGREFHIYGTGKDRAVYEVGRDRDDSGRSQAGGTSTTSASAGNGTTRSSGTATT
jgi:hypothetical protein